MTVALAVQSVEGPEIVIGYPWSIDLYVGQGPHQP